MVGTQGGLQGWRWLTRQEGAGVDEGKCGDEVGAASPAKAGTSTVAGAIEVRSCEIMGVGRNGVEAGGGSFAG